MFFELLLAVAFFIADILKLFIDLFSKRKAFGGSESTYLGGNFMPVHEEIEVDSFRIEGAIPTNINGAYLRNGPNPQYFSKYYHWFDGDGMIHAMMFNNGRVTYKNKYVETIKYKREKNDSTCAMNNLLLLGAMRYDPYNFYKVIVAAIKWGMRIPMDEYNNANTSVVYHGGKLLALTEVAKPVELDFPSLETIGIYDFKGALKKNMTAHPKTDHLTGELIFFGYPFAPIYGTKVSYCVADKDHNIIHSLQVPVSGNELIHDFAITRNYTIIPDLPLKLDIIQWMRGRGAYKFDKTSRTKFGIFPRYAKSSQEIVWFETSCCYFFHTVNAWEENDHIVLIALRQKETLAFGLCPNDDSVREHASLYEWRFDMKNRVIVSEKPIVTGFCVEFPSLNEKYWTKKNRFVYLGLFDDSKNIDGRTYGVLKADLQDVNKNKTYILPKGHYCGEFLYTASTDAKNEDDGYLMAFVHNEGANQSYFIILNAKSMEFEAKIEIPHRVPYGFHAKWIQQ